MEKSAVRYDVMPDGKDWVVRRRESMEDEIRESSRAAAIERGEAIARAEGARLVIHHDDGSVEEERAFEV